MQNSLFHLFSVPKRSVLLRVSNLCLPTWQHLESSSIYQGYRRVNLNTYRLRVSSRAGDAGCVILGPLSPGRWCWWTLVRQTQVAHTNWLLCHQRWDNVLIPFDRRAVAPFTGWDARILGCFFFWSPGTWTPIFTFIPLVPCFRDILPMPKSHSTFSQVGCVTSMFFIEVKWLFMTQVADRGTAGRGWTVTHHHQLHNLHLKESKCWQNAEL